MREEKAASVFNLSLETGVSKVVGGKLRGSTLGKKTTVKRLPSFRELSLTGLESKTGGGEGDHQ